MENELRMIDQEEWEYHNKRTGDDEMTDAERDKEYKYWESQFNAGKLDYEYSDYIMQNCGGDRMICNGDDLIGAMESHYLLDEFLGSRK